jgi:hypothetical protein
MSWQSEKGGYSWKMGGILLVLYAVIDMPNSTSNGNHESHPIKISNANNHYSQKTTFAMNKK